VRTISTNMKDANHCNGHERLRPGTKSRSYVKEKHRVCITVKYENTSDLYSTKMVFINAECENTLDLYSTTIVFSNAEYEKALDLYSTKTVITSVLVKLINSKTMRRCFR